MNQKPLWQRLEDAQYNKYKPRLDRMLERYGDMFEMDIYGTVTCTDSEYKDWQLACNAGADNFAIRLRRDELFPSSETIHERKLSLILIKIK